MGISPSSGTQNGVTAWFSLSGSTVTVEVSSMSYSWRINGTNSGGDHGTYYIGENRNAEGSFEAEDGHSYAFQVASGGSWSNGLIFTVTFDSGGGDEGGGGDDDGSDDYYYIHIESGNGVKELKVIRTWSNAWDSYNPSYTQEPMHDGDKIYYMDSFKIVPSALPGYALNTYNISGETTNFYVKNLLHDNLTHDTWRTKNPDDVYISATATPISSANIYNGTDFNPCFCYIYNNSKWDLYTPYIYSEASSSWEKYK